MKNTKKIFCSLTLILFLLVTPALAGTWTSNVIIDSLYVDSNGSGNVRLTTNGVNFCNGNNWVYVAGGDPGFSVKVSVLLAAYLSGKQVTYYIEQIGQACHVVEFHTV